MSEHTKYTLYDRGSKTGQWVCECGQELGDCPIDEIDEVFAQHQIDAHGLPPIDQEDIDIMNAPMGPIGSSLQEKLQARLSRYETAMREARRVLEAVRGLADKLINNGIVHNSDYYAGMEHGYTQAGDSILNVIGDDVSREALRAALSDQPAEEPAESKLEAPNELLKLVAQAFFIIGSLELSSFGNREANEAASAWRKKASAILDTQPSTPEPKA